MNLQENIKRILKEETTKKLIESVLNLLVLPQYEHVICGFELKNVDDKSLSDFINYPGVIVTFIGGKGTKLYPQTPGIQKMYDDVLDDIWDTVWDYTGISLELYVDYVKDCGKENIYLKEETNHSKHYKDKETFQYMVDFVIEEMKESCHKQGAENVEDLISFDACDFLESNTEIKVTSFDYYNDKPRLLIHITYLNTRYRDEESFISELSWRLKRWIGDNTVEIEDITYN